MRGKRRCNSWKEVSAAGYAELWRNSGSHVLVGTARVWKLAPGNSVRTNEWDRFVPTTGQLPDGDVDVRHFRVIVQACTG
jgi:hypothetical protein